MFHRILLPLTLTSENKLRGTKPETPSFFEVAGKRLFAYDAEQKRQLSDTELLAVEYVPFFEYYFEGNLPVETKR